MVSLRKGEIEREIEGRGGQRESVWQVCMADDGVVLACGGGGGVSAD